MIKELPLALELQPTKITHPKDPTKLIDSFALQRLSAPTEEGIRPESGSLFFIQTKVILALLGNEHELIDLSRSLHEQEIVKSIFSNITRRIQNINDPKITNIIEKIRSKLHSFSYESMRKEDADKINLDADETVIAAFTMALLREYKLHNTFEYETKDANDRPFIKQLYDLSETSYFKEMAIEKKWEVIGALLEALKDDMSTYNEKLSGMDDKYKFDLTYQEIWLLAKEILPHLPKLYILYNILNREELANFNVFGYRSINTKSVRLNSFRAWIVDFVAKNSTDKEDHRFVDEDTDDKHGLRSAKKWLTQVSTRMRNKPSSPRGN